MVDITHKSATLRIARAQACIKVSNLFTLQAIEQKTVPKGDVLESARIAALFGVKKTAELIPDCHPIPIEYTALSFDISPAALTLTIIITVKTIYKTGVEVEAMHGASIAALTMYDMLKPIDKGVEISNIKLLDKTGGKSSYRKPTPRPLTAAILVISDRVSAGMYVDKSGKAIADHLAQWQIASSISVVPDEIAAIQAQVKAFSQAGISLIITTGGTGLSPRDVTPQAIAPLLTQPIAGIMEAARAYGQERIPYAMLSRSLAGLLDNSLVLCFPGSSKAVSEYMQVLFPYVLHIFDVIEGKSHD